MIEGRTEDETVRLTAQAVGCSEDTARFIIAIERGEIDGDVIEVGDDGQPVRSLADAESESDRLTP